MQPEALRGIAPHLGEEGLDRLDALVVQRVDAARSLRLLDDEPGLLQQAEVARDRGAADRQRVGDLADRPAAGAEQLDDGPPVGVAQRLERVTGRRAHASPTVMLATRAGRARIRLLRALCSTSASPSASITGGT